MFKKTAAEMIFAAGESLSRHNQNTARVVKDSIDERLIATSITRTNVTIVWFFFVIMELDNA